MAKSQPFSVRMSPDALERFNAYAKRHGRGRSRSQLFEDLVLAGMGLEPDEVVKAAAAIDLVRGVKALAEKHPATLTDMVRKEKA